MSTTTVATSVVTAREEHRIALVQKENVHQCKTDAERRVRQFTSILNQRHDQPTPTASERFEALGGLPKAEHELALLGLEAQEIDQEETDARSALKLAIHRDCFTKKCAAIDDVVKAALAFRVVNEKLREIEVTEHEMTGDYQDFLAWPDFSSSSTDGIFTSRLDTWLVTVKAYQSAAP